MNTPSERAGWSREAIARLIDPSLMNWTHEGLKSMTSFDRNRIIDAKNRLYDTCSAIMALAPPSSLDGIGAGGPAGWVITYADGSGAFAFTREEADEALADALPGAVKRPVWFAALTAAPLPVGKQGVMADSGSPTPRRGSHTTDQRSTS